MHIDHRPSIARTNLMLAELRRAFGGASEVYVKWWYAGAFNGGAYAGEDGKALLDAAFWYLPDGRPVQASSLRCEIDGIAAHVDGPTAGTVDVPALLKGASRHFDVLLAEQGPALLSQVQRVSACAYLRRGIPYQDVVPVAGKVAHPEITFAHVVARQF